MDRQLGRRESTVQTQPSTEELRCDGAHNAVPKLDMNYVDLKEPGDGWRVAVVVMIDACTHGVI